MAYPRYRRSTYKKKSYRRTYRRSGYGRRRF